MAATMAPMNRSTRRAAPALALALVVLVAGCRAAAAPSASVAEPTSTPTSEPTATAEPTASAEPTATVEPTPSASADGELVAFPISPNPDADALFLDRDDCENLVWGYRLEFPDAWWTNTALGDDLLPCTYFSPTFYEIVDPALIPDEIAIIVMRTDSDFGFHAEPISLEAGLVGRTQPAWRTEWESPDGTTYTYVVQLGPTPEGGPNLIIQTSEIMGGDYELNKAVLDRIMATMELVGTTQ